MDVEGIQKTGVAKGAGDNAKRVIGNGGLFKVDPGLVQEDNEENLRGFIKTRGSLIPGEEFVYWFI